VLEKSNALSRPSERPYKKTNSLTYTGGPTAGAYVGKAFTLKDQGAVSLDRIINIPQILFWSISPGLFRYRAVMALYPLKEK